MSDDVELLTQKILLFCSSRRYDLMVQFGRELLALDPSNLAAHFSIIRGHFGQEQLDEMYRACRLGLEFHPTEGWFYYYLYRYYAGRRVQSGGNFIYQPGRFKIRPIICA